jgi:hypothetical protein
MKTYNMAIEKRNGQHQRRRKKSNGMAISNNGGVSVAWRHQ